MNILTTKLSTKNDSRIISKTLTRRRPISECCNEGEYRGPPSIGSYDDGPSGNVATKENIEDHLVWGRMTTRTPSNISHYR